MPGCLGALLPGCLVVGGRLDGGAACQTGNVHLEMTKLRVLSVQVACFLQPVSMPCPGINESCFAGPLGSGDGG